MNTVKAVSPGLFGDGNILPRMNFRVDSADKGSFPFQMLFPIRRALEPEIRIRAIEPPMPEQIAAIVSFSFMFLTDLFSQWQGSIEACRTLRFHLGGLKHENKLFFPGI